MSYNTSMSELPVSCPACHEELMVDMENLDRRPVDKVVTRLGTNCTNCDTWVTISYTTRSLDEAFAKLAKRSTDSKGYHFHFAKTLLKCEGIQEKYGAF